MTFYLSKKNESLLPPILKLLKDPSKGEVKLFANSLNTLEHILRNAANTKYPELKRWRFKRKVDYVLAIPREIVVIQDIQSIEEVTDYISLIQYIIEHPNSEGSFPNAHLDINDMNKLETFLVKRKQKFDRLNGVLIILNDDTQPKRLNEDREEDRSK